MKVRLLDSVGGEPSYSFGQEVDLPSDIAEAWIKEGLAEPLRGQKIERAIAEPPRETTEDETARRPKARKR